MAVAERNCYPPLLFGRFGDGRRFYRDELIWVLASNGRGWTRAPRESAEGFEARIIQCLMERVRTACRDAVGVGGSRTVL